MSNKSGPFQRLFPTLSTKLRTTRSEFMFITVLLLIPAFPLVILRGASWIGDARIVFLQYLIWLPICGLWLKSTKPNTKLKNPRTNYRSGTLGAGSSKFLCIILPLFLLLTFTVIAFYIPLKQRFWVGIDEGLYFGMKGESFWSSFFDLYLNR